MSEVSRSLLAAVGLVAVASAVWAGEADRRGDLAGAKLASDGGTVSPGEPLRHDVTHVDSTSQVELAVAGQDQHLLRLRVEPGDFDGPGTITTAATAVAPPQMPWLTRPTPTPGPAPPAPRPNAQLNEA